MKIKIKFLILASLSLLMNSCFDKELHKIYVQIRVINKTQQNLQCFYGKRDFSFSDSAFQVRKNETVDSLFNGGIMQCGIDTTINQDNILSDLKFSELISKFKIYYVQNGDTFKVNNQFYDGKSCWKSESSRQIDGIMFIKYYWLSGYTATLTDNMFVKK